MRRGRTGRTGLTTALCLLGSLVCAPGAVAGDVTIDWFIGGDYPDLELLPDDTVTFVWSGNHDVYMFPDASSFAACDFSGATVVCVTSPCVWNPPSDGVFYFGCQVGTHCASGGMKQLVTVAGSPPAVPDGTFGLPLTVGKGDPLADSIDLNWDATTCPGDDYNVIAGDLHEVASLAVASSVCDLGTGGSATWPGTPAGDLWFLMVSDDASGTEGTWGYDSAGADRAGTSPSLECGNTARVNAPACP